MDEIRCFGCMAELDNDTNICPVCGFDKSAFTQPDHALPLGTVLHAGKYLVGKVLGQGGFGITYIGLDLTLNMKVAIKEYFPQTLASRMGGTSELAWHTTVEDRESGRASFVKEARNMAKINEIAHIVQVRDIFFQNETAYIVMNYIEGETLKQKLEREGVMHESDCLQLLTPIIEALDEAHDAGLIHRDISPDNIMIDKKGKVWLLDMGAAKSLDTLSHNAPQSTHLVIRHGFSPIEQFADAGRIGPWTDVYAMAATIYYCMTGKVMPDSLNRLSEDNVTYPVSMSSVVRDAITKGVALKPEDRYRSMHEFLSGLRGEEQKPSDSDTEKKEPKAAPIVQTSPKTENVEEAGTGKSASSGLNTKILAVCIALVLIVVAVGVGLGMSKNGKNKTEETATGTKTGQTVSNNPTDSVVTPGDTEPTKDAAATPTQEPLSTSTPTPTLKPTATSTPTSTPTPAPTATSTPTPKPTATPTPKPTSTPTPTPKPTATPKPTKAPEDPFGGMTDKEIKKNIPKGSATYNGLKFYSYVVKNSSDWDGSAVSPYASTDKKLSIKIGVESSSKDSPTYINLSIVSPSGKKITGFDAPSAINKGDETIMSTELSSMKEDGIYSFIIKDKDSGKQILKMKIPYKHGI